MTTYSNPRLEAIISDWPTGGRYKTTIAHFKVDTHHKHGQRAARTTNDPRTNMPSKPKLGTYAPKVWIVDGDDGKTYIASMTSYGFVNVMQGNMQLQAEAIFDCDPRFAEAMALFDLAPVVLFNP